MLKNGGSLCKAVEQISMRSRRYFEDYFELNRRAQRKACTPYTSRQGG
jgi:hypothetical protein